MCLFSIVPWHLFTLQLDNGPPNKHEFACCLHGCEIWSLCKWRTLRTGFWRQHLDLCNRLVMSTLRNVLLRWAYQGGWGGRVCSTHGNENTYVNLVGNFEGKIPFGRHDRRWNDNIKKNFKRDWIFLSHMIINGLSSGVSYSTPLSGTWIHNSVGD